ncbi:hypothetical protein HY501_01980 [Candidatus Woesearchaeota archaeon]|nr:hypothetical protein [Candidatus Woesearchaeota archaeon]
MAEREYVLIAIPLALIVLVVLALTLYTFYPEPFKQVFGFASETMGLATEKENEIAAVATADLAVNAFASCLKLQHEGCSCSLDLLKLPEDYTITIENKLGSASVLALDADEKPLTETVKSIKDTKVGVAVMQLTTKKVLGKDSPVLEIGCVFPEKTTLRGDGSSLSLLFAGSTEQLSSPALVRVNNRELCLVSEHLLRTDYPKDPKASEDYALYRNLEGYPYALVDYYENFLRANTDEMQIRILLSAAKDISHEGLDLTTARAVMDPVIEESILFGNMESFYGLFLKDLQSCEQAVWPLRSGVVSNCKGVPGLKSETAFANEATFTSPEDAEVLSITSGKITEKCMDCALKRVQIETEDKKISYAGFTEIASLGEAVTKGQVLGKSKALSVSILTNNGKMVNPLCLNPQRERVFYQESCSCQIADPYGKQHPDLKDCRSAPLERAMHCSVLL